MSLIAKRDSSRRRRCEMKDKVVLGGSIIAAIAASLCCLGPLVAVALGMGAFGAAAAFESIRPYLLGVTALLLAVAFYLTYRKREVRCEDGSCQVRGASRASKMMLWFATIAVIAFAAFPYYSGALLRASTKKNASPANSETASNMSNPGEAVVVVKVSGMTCDSCAFHIQNALTKVPGVKSADVSYEKGQAVVSYDPGATNPDAIRAAIDATGYKAGEVISQTPQPSQPKLATAVIGVEGMTCGSCAVTTRLALSKVNGVSSAEMSFEKKEAKVTYDPALVTPDRLKAAIDEAGFKATEVRLIARQ